MIDIIDLSASIDGKQILKNLNLSIGKGEIHAIMGPNGAGKSTLARVLAGHPSYEITGGEIWLKKQNLLEMEPEERAHLGLFVSFQYPPEITGISNVQFLQASFNALRAAKELEPLSPKEFDLLLEETMRAMEIRSEFKERGINEGFSGGEKKKNEILQMALFRPDLAVLDETDSGLDIDAMKIVAQGLNRLKNQDNALLLITHYQRLLDHIRPDFIHILSDGAIVRSGGFELAGELESKGYQTCSS
jgi:Fe-S cluster assembly ATP-binding protein